MKGFELSLLVDSFLWKCELGVEDATKISDFVITFADAHKKMFKHGGNGTCLIKPDLFFHVEKHVEMFGPPSGWDSCHPKECQKTENKAPFFLTQRNASPLVKQTHRQRMDHQALKHAMTSLKANNVPPNIKPVWHMAGA